MSTVCNTLTSHMNEYEDVISIEYNAFPFVSYMFIMKDN